MSNTRYPVPSHSPADRKKGPQVIYGLTPAVVGSVTLTAEQGTYIVTGQDVRFDLDLVIAQGAYSITGQSANLATTLIATQGTYVYSGQDAALRSTFSIVAEQGSYAVSGQTVRFDSDVSISQGTYAYTGQDAKFQIKLLIAQGVYVVSGQDVVLGASVTMPADQGSYSITGQDARFAIDVVAGQGAFALSGQDVRFGLGLAAGQGAYVLSGGDAELQAPVTLEAEQGIYLLAGQDVALTIVERQVVSAVGDDYPWPEERDERRKRQWERELEVKRILRRQLSEIVQSLEARGESEQVPAAREARKALRQARKRYAQPSGMLDFDRMANEINSIRRLFTEYGGGKFAQALIESYQIQIARAAGHELIGLEEALSVYDEWEREHVNKAVQAAWEFSNLMQIAVDAKKIPTDRH